MVRLIALRLDFGLRVTAALGELPLIDAYVVGGNETCSKTLPASVSQANAIRRRNQLNKNGLPDCELQVQTGLQACHVQNIINDMR